MATITFDKGIITYTDNENNYNYSIDINNGIITNNRTNRKNKSLPPKFINACTNLMRKRWAGEKDMNNCHLSNIIFYFYMRGNKEYNFYQLRIIDKLSAIGMYITTLPTAYVMIEKNMARIAKRYKDFPDSTLDDILFAIQQEDIEKIIRNYCSPDSPYYDYFRTCYTTFSKDKLSFVAYFLAHGLWDFYVRGETEIKGWRKNDTYTNITDTLADYFHMCDYFKKPYEKSDFFKQFVALSKTYKIEQMTIENNVLKDFYLRYANKISFENNDFEVILPTCREDFKQEADSQHNCVYTTYFPKVLKNETIVVFIRRKAEIAKSYITCEIGINSGLIKQYLAKYNQQVTDKNAINFKKDYQDFLYTNF